MKPENLRDNINLPAEAADARATIRSLSDRNDAAAKYKKEDDIRNKCVTITNDIENKGNKNIEQDTIENKIDYDENKTDYDENKIDYDENKKIKVTKIEDKTTRKNKNIYKTKEESPRPDLNSITKNKSKNKTAKPSVVNVRKITEFILLKKDETPKYKNTQKPAEQTAKQDSLQIGPQSDNRKGGDRKQAVIENYFTTGNITQPSKGYARRNVIGQM